MPIDFRTHICLLFIPLIVANVFHMLIVKRNIWATLAIPLSSEKFGEGKTWRGFVILPLFTAILSSFFNYACLTVGLNNVHAFFIGFGLGLSYLIWELPNSFIKRKLGIDRGDRSRNMPVLQLFTDKADSLIGVFLFYYLLMPINIFEILLLFALSMTIHIFLSYLLFILKIKKSF